MMTQHRIGTQEQWQAERDELLKEEKELTRRSDDLARKRQALPWVRSRGRPERLSLVWRKLVCSWARTMPRVWSEVTRWSPSCGPSASASRAVQPLPARWPFAAKHAGPVLLEDVQPARHEPGALLDKAVRPATLWREDAARNREDLSSLLRGEAGRDQRAAGVSGLDHERSAGQPADDPGRHLPQPDRDVPHVPVLRPGGPGRRPGGCSRPARRCRSRASP